MTVDIEIASEITDHAEEMLIVASEDGFIGSYDATFEYERGDYGWLLAVHYSDDGKVLAKYRVDVVVVEEEEIDE